MTRKVDESHISDLQYDPRNARKRTIRSSAMIQSSLQEVGASRSIVIDEHNRILAGNGTIEAAGQIGIEKMIIVDADGETIVAVRRSGLTEDQKIKLALFDNRASDLSEWDADILAELGQEVDLSGLFTENELAVIPANNESGEGSGEEVEEKVSALIDEAESGAIESRVSLGQIWKLGRHYIACGDSTDEGNVRKLLGDRLGDVGMVWADPPFNTKQQQGRTSSDWGIIENDNMSDAEFDGFVSKLFKVFALMPESPLYVCCHWKSYPIFFKGRSKMNALIVWVKNNFGLGSGYRPQHEFICFWGHLESSSESNVWQIARDAAATYKHPMQKPTELLEKALFNSSKPDDLIFDPFLGSAPSIIAAQKMEGDRAVFGFELSEAYCEVICRRFESLTGINAELVGNLTT